MEKDSNHTPTCKGFFVGFRGVPLEEDLYEEVS